MSAILTPNRSTVEALVRSALLLARSRRRQRSQRSHADILEGRRSPAFVGDPIVCVVATSAPAAQDAAETVAVDIAGGTVRRAGIALTGVGSTTVHAVDAGESLVGGALDEAAIQRAAELAANAAKPRSDHRGSATYKRHIINTFTARVLRGIAESQEKAA